MIELPPGMEAKLETIAAQRGVDVQDVVIDALRRLEPPKPKAPEHRGDEPVGEYLLRIAAEMRASIPAEELAKIPSDLSINHDHYLYGAPKVEE
jgi:hypothetical protein